MKNKIFLFPLSLAVIFFSSMIIIFSPAGKKNIINVPAPIIFPTPTSVPWQTYQNEKYNFEFQYPRNWEPVTDNFATSSIVEVKKLNPILLTITDKSKESSCGPYLCYSSISVYTPIKNLSKLTGRNWLEKFYLDNKLINNKENLDKLNLVEATISGLYTLREENRVFIFYNNQVFVIELVIQNGTDKNYLEKTYIQILSTIKFLPDTSTWKTYKNSGFEFKYPHNWYIFNREDNSALSISNKPIDNNTNIEQPFPGQIFINFYFFHSAFENGLGVTEFELDDGVPMISDTKYIAENNSFGMAVVYRKLDDANTINTAHSTADQILSTFKFIK